MKEQQQQNIRNLKDFKTHLKIYKYINMTNIALNNPILFQYWNHQGALLRSQLFTSPLFIEKGISTSALCFFLLQQDEETGSWQLKLQAVRITRRLRYKNLISHIAMGRPFVLSDNYRRCPCT